MKNLLSCVFIVLIFSKISHAQSLLPECEGNNKNILEFSTKHFKKVRKWTDCQGTTVSPRGDRYIGDFKDGKFHGQGVFIYSNGDKYCIIHHQPILDASRVDAFKTNTAPQGLPDIAFSLLITKYGVRPPGSSLVLGQ